MNAFNTLRGDSSDFVARGSERLNGKLALQQLKNKYSKKIQLYTFRQGTKQTDRTACMWWWVLAIERIDGGLLFSDTAAQGKNFTDMSLHFEL